MKRSLNGPERDSRLEQKADGHRRKPTTRDEAAPAADIHSAGNQAIQTILRKARPSSGVKVSQPEDSHEREADRIAEQASSPQIQRKPAVLSGAPRAEAGDISQALGSSGGRPLDGSVRERMEERLGQDFSSVRVHTDEAADRSARQLGADAYTVGRDIVFGAGQYAPQTGTGEKLLAHELVHVAQQERGSGSSGPIQRQKSANQALTDAAGVPATMDAVSFSATLAGGQELISDTDKTIHTVSDTRVEALVTSTRLTIDFTPELVITMKSFPYSNIWVEQIYFDFATARIGWTISARGATWAVSWLSGLAGGSEVSASVGAGLQALFAHLPAVMSTPGYDPFADPDLASNVNSFLSSLSSGGGGGAKLPTATNVGMRADFTLGGEIRKGSGRISLVIPSGTHVSVDVDLQGGIPESLSDVRVNEIRLNLDPPSGSSANIELEIMKTGIPVIFLHRATFSAGGRLEFSYTLATEALEGFFRVLLVSAAVESGQADKVGENALDPRQPTAHAVVDSQIRENLEPLLRDLVLSNRGAISGIDLADVLGYSPK
ncbi:MAG TPA: DUF4157 domain-containing protein [Anaerolineales bacterium]|nr:DUF4157 domain-containing protein [Anaerolineales bacterium]